MLFCSSAAIGPHLVANTALSCFNGISAAKANGDSADHYRVSVDDLERSGNLDCMGQSYCESDGKAQHDEAQRIQHFYSLADSR